MKKIPIIIFLFLTSFSISFANVFGLINLECTNEMLALDISNERNSQTTIIESSDPCVKSETIYWLLKPDSSSEIFTLRPRFLWNKQDQSSYFLYIAENDNMNGEFLANVVFTKFVIHDTSYKYSNFLEFNKQYYWQSVGMHISPCNPSVVWSFKTFDPLIFLKYPMDELVTTIKPTYLQWNRPQGINIFNLQVSTNPNFTSNLVVNETAYPDTVYSTSSVIKNKRYFWRVQSLYGPKAHLWSATRSLTVIDNNLQKLYPDSAENISNTSINLSWKSLEGANSYSVRLSNSSQFFNFIVDTTTVMDTSILVPNLEINKTYYWTVTATTDLGIVQSSVWQFTTVSKPLLVEPSDRTIDKGKLITFKWRGLGGLSAKSFLQISDQPNFSNLIEDVPNLLDTTYFYDGTNSLKQNKTYYWRIKQLVGQDSTKWSDEWSFTTKLLPKNSQIYPDSNAVGVPCDTMLHWNPSTNVEGYTVRVSTVPNFSTTVLERSPLIEVLQTEVSQLENNQKYYWQIRTRKDGEFSNWSNTWPFLTILEKPNLVQPLNEATISPTKLTFSWQSVEGVEHYNLKISLDSSFKDAIIDTVGILQTSFEDKTLFADATYYWKVKSSSSQNVGQWSTIRNFTIKTISSVEQSENFEAIIFPNLANAFVRIKIKTSENEQIQQITIRNIIGIEVARLELPSNPQNFIEIEYNLNSYSNGMYFIEVSSNSKKSSYPILIFR